MATAGGREGDGSAHDGAVMETASDASLCKLSASALGYFRDPFVQFFVKSPSRRMPIINRGYYARVAAVETLLTKFLAAAETPDGKKKQVVILGAGLDTMFFRLKEAGGLAQCEYFELDFPDVTMQKVAVMRRRKALAALVGLDSTEAFMAAVSSGECLLCGYELVRMGDVIAVLLITQIVLLFPGYSELNANGYHLLPCDLRDMESTKAKLEAAGIDKRCECNRISAGCAAGISIEPLPFCLTHCRHDCSAPTLFISECVLIYMDAHFSSRVISWSAEFFDDVGYVLYEQILPDDAFGRVMMANIKARGCDLLSIRDYPTLEAQIARFREHNFEAVQAWDMNEIYYQFLDAAERIK